MSRAPIPEKLRAQAGRWRTCVVCRKSINTTQRFGELCGRCGRLRKQNGDARVHAPLQMRDWQHLLAHVRRAMAKAPPSPEILASAARLFDPGEMPRPRDMRTTNPRYLWWREATWFADERSRKTRRRHHGHYKPKGIIAILTAVTTYMEEREGHGYPADAEDTMKARALLSMFWRPKGRKRAPGTVRKQLVKKLREATALRVYCLVSARTVLTRLAEIERAKLAKPRLPARAHVPPKPPAPPKPIPRVPLSAIRRVHPTKIEEERTS